MFSLKDFNLNVEIQDTTDKIDGSPLDDCSEYQKDLERLRDINALLQNSEVIEIAKKYRLIK